MRPWPEIGGASMISAEATGLRLRVRTRPAQLENAEDDARLRNGLQLRDDPVVQDRIFALLISKPTSSALTGGGTMRRLPSSMRSQFSRISMRRWRTSWKARAPKGRLHGHTDARINYDAPASNAVRAGWTKLTPSALSKARATTYGEPGGETSGDQPKAASVFHGRWRCSSSTKHLKWVRAARSHSSGAGIRDAGHLPSSED